MRNRPVVIRFDVFAGEIMAPGRQVWLEVRAEPEFHFNTGSRSPVGIDQPARDRRAGLHSHGDRVVPAFRLPSHSHQLLRRMLEEKHPWAGRIDLAYREICRRHRLGPVPWDRAVIEANAPRPGQGLPVRPGAPCPLTSNPGRASHPASRIRHSLVGRPGRRAQKLYISCPTVGMSSSLTANSSFRSRGREVNAPRSGGDKARPRHCCDAV